MEKTPLYKACENGHFKIVKILLENQANTYKCRIDTGASPLYIASQHGHLEIIKILLTNFGDINKERTDKGVTPLYIACQKVIEI